MSIIEKAAKRLEQNRAEKASEAGNPGSEVHSAPEGPYADSFEDSPHDPAEAPHQAAEEPLVMVEAADEQKTVPQEVGEPDENLIAVTGLENGLYLSPDEARSRTADEFRIIKRPLLVKAFDSSPARRHHSNLIMVTSSVQSEGKSFVTLNLAISIAMEMDSTVLLVDADVARPGMSRRLGIVERSGLIERLTEEQDDLSALLLRTDIPKLTVLPAGSRHRRATELLASLKMRNLLDEMASRYSDRIVLFDSPPLLESTEASVLASQMGQVVVVVESESTSQMLVKETLSQLDDLENVSLVLNKCKESLLTRIFAGKYSAYAYGYGYGYGGYGYGDDRDK